MLCATSSTHGIAALFVNKVTVAWIYSTVITHITEYFATKVTNFNGALAI